MHGGSVSAHSAGLGTRHRDDRAPAESAARSSGLCRRRRRAERTGRAGAPRRAASSSSTTTRMPRIRWPCRCSWPATRSRTAYDGQEGLELAFAFAPDVLLLDLGMPGLNGFEIARRIRQQPWGQSVDLIAVTGWGQEQDRRRTKEAGFNAHLTKPVSPAELFGALATAVQNAAAQNGSHRSQAPSRPRLSPDVSSAVGSPTRGVKVAAQRVQRGSASGGGSAPWRRHLALRTSRSRSPACGSSPSCPDAP